ncbi:MAG: hypothetical protein A2231_03425 [Candidatus Firestonebacteria bacterium RIFOXYA2_FULL_40_8]|nr:MAG: hypothetical protein A2231_03425 [Candidatus Firestonebacteria bacterium RIFOXYA2_FULL_40_8]
MLSRKSTALLVWAVFFFSGITAVCGAEIITPKPEVTSEILSAEKKAVTSETLLAPKSEITSEEKIPVDCSADHLEYDEEKGLVNGKGNVKITYKTTVITADEVKFDVKSSDIEAKGNITLKEGENLILGEYVTFNMKSKTGHIDKIQLSNGPWYFKGLAIEKPDEKNASIIEGYATTCKDKEHPHYRMVSQRIHVEIDNVIESWNVLLYIGDIPVFYFPYIWKSLKSSPKSPISITPGISGNEGAFVKLAYNYELSEYMSGAILLDLMAKMGIGYGLQQNYRFQDGVTGGYLYAYYILDQTTLHERFRVDFDHSSRIGKNLSIVGRLNFLSDEALTKDFYSYYYPVISRNIRSYIAASYYEQFFSIVTAVDRQDVYKDGKYQLANIYLPTLNFSTTAMAIGTTNAYWNVGANLSYYMLDAAASVSKYYVLRLGLSPSLSHTLKLDQANTLSTSFNLSAVTQNKPDYNYIGPLDNLSYSFAVNLHSVWNMNMDADLYHNYSQKLTGNYGGVLNNRLTVRMNLRVGSFISNTTTTGYNFLNPYADVKKNFDNLLNYMNVFISDEFNASLSLQYSIAEGMMKSADLFTNIGKPTGAKASFGINYLNNKPYGLDILDLTGSLAMNLNDDLRVEYGARFDTTLIKFKEHRIAVSTNITDCWYGDINISSYNNNYSVGFTLQLRAFKESALDRKLSPEVYKY